MCDCTKRRRIFPYRGDKKAPKYIKLLDSAKEFEGDARSIINCKYNSFFPEFIFVRVAKLTLAHCVCVCVFLLLHTTSTVAKISRVYARLGRFNWKYRQAAKLCLQLSSPTHSRSPCLPHEFRCRNAKSNEPFHANHSYLSVVQTGSSADETDTEWITAVLLLYCLIPHPPASSLSLSLHPSIRS